MTQNNFYRAFEDKHRGSRELIEDRLTVYLPFIEQFKGIYGKDDLKALDLGCGRGEWLELLKENGIDGCGVDLDDGMLAACRERDLNIVKADALDYALKQEENSFIIISGFHIAEHLPFEKLHKLINESLRLLKPGGLLILETPNPENIRVATVNFYLDPSHVRPIPPMLLLFLTEYYGFGRSKILRLQESKELKDLKSVSLLQVITGVSPDYAVIAQKKASLVILDLFNKPFSKEYGLSLETISENYEDRISKVDAKVEDNEQALRQTLETISENYEDRISKVDAKVEIALDQANQAWQQYYMTIKSNSWKITKPLRFAAKNAKWFMRESVAWITLTPNSRPRHMIKKILIYSKHQIIKYSKLKNFAKLLLLPFPKLTYKLKYMGQDDKTSYAPLRVEKNIKQIEDILNAAKYYIDNNLDFDELYPFAAIKNRCLKRRYGGYAKTSTNCNWTNMGGWLGTWANDEKVGIGILDSYGELPTIIDRYKEVAEEVFFPYPKPYLPEENISFNIEGLLLFIFDKKIFSNREFYPVKDELEEMLSPMAKKIYNNLKTVIESKKRENQ